MPKVKVLVGGQIWDIDFIEHDGRTWLVPLWSISPDGKSRRPLRLIAPRFAPGHKPAPGPEVLAIFRQMPIPAFLLEQGVIPPELAPLIEVRENPDIWLPNAKPLN